ncbi:PREDICTED: formin-like protein 1 [Chaetura pelagica]|uniref:formin-like protein 1 n=1 Tax=Chaetura pelagica TaxID=8897 RepID=UPI000523872D|nr:PREDICTED: formin-like protein 1 [Chaetura pelagica]
MNLPPDKMELLNQYDNEKKWELICDQERFQVKNPPAAYIQKLKSCLDTGGVSRKVRATPCPPCPHPGWGFKRRVQESTQVLRELEISLRTNYIGLNPSHSRKALRSSRLVSQKDDVHLCIMCLRAIMNYQSGFSLVMNHPACVNEITLSLNNRNARTKALVLELLAAVCLVRGGHDIILAAFDNFKEVCGEKNRFEKLMDYFRNDDTNIDFMVACMQFINIVVHSVENMNFRVFLQYEFTHLGLDQYLESLRLTESDKLQVQIQAYLDNVFDVGAMLEDSETKTAVLEHMEELQEHVSQLTQKLQDEENDSMAKIAELEKQLSQARRELEALRLPAAPSAPPTSNGSVKVKKPIQTKFRMPVFNWVALKPNQIDGTVFNELNDEKVLQELDMSDFEEQFKTKAQGPALDISALKVKATQKAPSKVTLMESNRAKNLAITLRKGGRSIQDICAAIETYDQQALSLDFLELLLRFLPTEDERTLIRKARIPRLAERMNVMIFLGNFSDTAQLLMPQLNAIIAASMSLKSSSKLRNILEIVLAFGNYMNSSKRGAAYGFRLQSLDALLEMKSTDRKQTLLHYLVRVITEKYPELSGFHTELHFLDKAGSGSARGLRKAEQDIELWKKQEAAAKEAESSPPGSEEQPEVKVPTSPSRAKRQQMDMIAELKKKQMVKEPLIYEGKDGAIEDIISALKSVPFTARTGKRSSRLFCDVSFPEECPL